MCHFEEKEDVFCSIHGTSLREGQTDGSGATVENTLQTERPNTSVKKHDKAVLVHSKSYGYIHVPKTVPQLCKSVSMSMLLQEDDHRSTKGRVTFDIDEYDWKKDTLILDGIRLAPFYRPVEHLPHTRPLGRGKLSPPRALTRQGMFRDCGCYTRNYIRRSNERLNEG